MKASLLRQFHESRLDMERELAYADKMRANLLTDAEVDAHTQETLERMRLSRQTQAKMLQGLQMKLERLQRG